ncbi:MAG: pyridoxamine 5'-phosphate oxidase family protein [Actinomycetota bacterium]|nr:pyridoxamine 5'-phosphate oxidase family protein [Actinomycetota bacterium]
MHETPADLQRLQTLLDDSIERASAFLRSSFQMPEHSLSAAQLVAHLKGSLTVALGTVTARGEPRVAPIAAFFLRASFYMPTVAEAARARNLARRPGASLTYFEGTDLAVVAHGHAAIVDSENPDFAELDATQVECGNQSVRDWPGHGVYLHLQPASLFTFARDPDRYPPARA